MTPPSSVLTLRFAAVLTLAGFLAVGFLAVGFLAVGCSSGDSSGGGTAGDDGTPGFGGPAFGDQGGGSTVGDGPSGRGEGGGGADGGGEHTEPDGEPGSEPDPADDPDPGSDPDPDPGDDPDRTGDPDPTDDEGCDEGRIVASAAGSACAEPCTAGACPDGAYCQSFTGEGGASGPWCLERAAMLCQPCSNNLDCNPLMDGAVVDSTADDDVTHRNRCIPLGDAGSYCGVPCDVDACPDGYECQTLQADAGDSKQCVPLSLSCECNGMGQELGAATECFATNGTGTCVGQRACTAAGLEACPASAASGESCNGLDDDCDGDIDEGVASPCGDCGDVCTLEAKPGDGTSVGTSQDLDQPGSGLDQLVEARPFIWIANSAEGTVSRLDTDNGCEVARHYVGADPSRTAVDFGGNGIVACRGDGLVYKIAPVEELCIDYNGDGVIQTSKDANGDCTVTTNEMVADDECVLWKVAPGGGGGCSGNGPGCARAAGVDGDGHIWIGSWPQKMLYRLDGETGATLTTLPLSVRPYGLAIDGEQRIWVASRDPHALALVDPLEGEVQWWPAPMAGAYGLAVDPYGGVWMASGEASSVQRFDAETWSWQTFTDFGLGRTRGVAVKVDYGPQGDVVGARVYLAHHDWASGCSSNGLHRSISVIDAKTLQVLPSIDLGSDKAPVGVAIDNSGHLWTVNQCDSTATKIDTTNHQVVGSYPVGMSPYTYSDMTGYALKTITSIRGDFRHVFKGWDEGLTLWQSITVNAGFPDETTWLEVRYRAGPDPEALQDIEWEGPFGPYPAEQSFPLPVGLVAPYLDVKVTGYAKSLVVLPALESVVVEAHKL